MALFESRNADNAAETSGKRARTARRSADSVDDMRRRARHRLIGACVLVLGAIVLFPLLFDSEPRPVPINAQVSVTGGDSAPAQTSAAPTQVAALSPAAGHRDGLADGEEMVDVGNANGNAPAGSAPAASVPPSTAANAPAAAPSARQSGAQEPTSVAAQRAQERRNEQARKAAEAAKPAPTPAPPPAQTPPKPAPEKPTPAAKPPAPAAPPAQAASATPPPPAAQAQPANREREAARARALLEGRPVESATPASRGDEGRFIIQVGAFSDEAKVREIRQKLEGLGLRTYTQVVQTGGGRATRVRVGPFASRAEADRAAAKVKGASLPAAIMSM